MDALFTLAAAILGLVALDLAALRFGADSRGLDRSRPDWW